MNRSALWVGAGCLGCIGVPSLLAIGGAGGYLLATQREPVSISVAPERDAREDDSWETSSLRPREETPARPVVKELAVEATPTATPVAREIVIATPVRTAATPAPIATPAKPAPTPESLAKLSSPISTPVAKELAKIAAPVATPVVKELAKVAAPISTPAPAAAKALKDMAKAAPIPKSTPRNFDEPEFKTAKPAKPSKVASAAGASATPETEEDVAVAALFGDAPGSSIRTIKTRGGPVQVTIGKKVAIQGADKKAVLGILEKVEGGQVSVRLGDGKIRTIAESDVVDASEL